MTQNIQPPAPKDPDTAFILELVGGLFGILGLGYMYVGRTEGGIIRLIAWLAYNVTAWFTIVILSAFIVGCLCIPVQLAIQIGVPIWSAYTIKSSMSQK